MVSSSMRSDKTAVLDDEYPDSARQLPTTPPGHDSYRPPSSLRSDVCGVTFSGDPDENVAEFIRRVQQAPLVQADSSNKDQKIAEYAMGCLTDEALIWACELEEDIQQSWTQLRRELVRRFAPDQSRGPSTAGSPRSSRSSRPTAPEPPVGREGIIELVDYEDGRVVGKLSIGPGDTAVCTTLPKDEMRIEIPASPTDTFEIKELWHLSHPITLELSNQSDDNYENTELDELPLGPASMSAVDSTRNRASNNSTPDQLIRRAPPGTGNRPLILNGRIASSFHIWPAPPHHPFLGVALVTSNRAGSNVPSSRLLGGPPAAQPTATKWVFKHCASSEPRLPYIVLDTHSEIKGRIGDRIYRRRSDVLRSPGATGSARIWKISTDEDGIEELSIFWMENDLSLSELG
ncbi:hypothetical protein FRB99_002341, partial [Tulasnella sp. 403]